MFEPRICEEQTRKWITDVVIGLNFCPFAAREMKRNTVRFTSFGQEDPAQCLQALLDEIQYLDNNPGIETSFLLFPDCFPDFMDFLNLVDLAEGLIEREGYEGIYQVASFHPNYQFAGSPADDPANYTNRSPYPMLHLLREESVEQALEHYAGNADEIPARNIQVSREKGLIYMKMLRENCLK